MTAVRCTASIVTILLCSANIASGATWHVNTDGTGDAPTIQEAIGMAAAGDTIALADGRYTGPGNRDITYLGKAITLRSENGNPAACVIDCEAGPSERHRGFLFRWGEGSNAVLEGVTVTGGYRARGAGVLCRQDSNPTIRNCIIAANYAEDNGGGIYCADASPTIEECLIQGNEAENGGAGIYCVNSRSVIRDNSIQQNRVLGTEGFDMGGGICIVYSSLSLTVIGNNIQGNAAYAGGGINCFQSHPAIRGNTIDGNRAYGGGGIGLCCGSRPTISENRIEGNEAYDLGGGIYCNSGSVAIIRDNVIAANVASGGYSYGGGICCNESSPLVTNNIIGRNSAMSGGGISCRATSNPTMFSNTICDNAARWGGGVHCDNGSKPTLDRCIIAFSSQGSAVACSDASAVPSISCSDIYGNADGDWVGHIAEQQEINGNLAIDPLFCDLENMDLSVSNGSPCLPGNHPNGESCDLIGALGEGCSPMQVTLDIKPRSCPNPFNVKVFEWNGALLPRKGGVMPVAILGGDELSVTEIDPATLRLEGVPPLSIGKVARVEDVAAPPTSGDNCACTVDGPDGFEDLSIKFAATEIASVLKTGVPGESRQLSLSGMLRDGTPFTGTDCVVFVGPPIKDDEAAAEDDQPRLSEVSPNPFNARMLARYVVPKANYVVLSVYDVRGRLVATLHDGMASAGDHVIQWCPGDVASGVYFLTLRAGTAINTRRLVLVK